MPKIQLIRRDSSIIELDANTITFDLKRNTTVAPIPFLGQRFGIDTNLTDVGISIGGIVTDDDSEVLGTGSAFTIDLSQASGTIPSSTWYGQYSTSAGSWNTVKADLDGVEISFKSKGQLDAGLGETTAIRLANGTTTSSVADSIIGVNISSTTTSDSLATTIVNALNSASITINGATTAFTTAFSISQAKGQQMNNSYYHQTGDISTVYNGEQILIKNKSVGSGGDVAVTIQKGVNAGSNTYALVDGSRAKWDKSFYVSNMTGGVDSNKMTMGDKVQELLNLANMSAGGALLSPNTLTGDVIDLPDSVASFDASRFLQIEDAEVVKKYIVGVRVPYESIASSSTGQEVLRQFVVPAGPGTNYSASQNTREFDPVSIVNNEKVRPNPYLEQGVALPCTLLTWNPSYEAGDGFWSYELSLAVVEQLVGI